MKNLLLAGLVAWSLLILAVSLIPDHRDPLEKGIREFRWDYLEHVIAYFILGGLFIFWRGNRDFGIGGLEISGLLLYTIGMAVLTEYLQIRIPGRSFNIIDMICNLAGVLASLVFIYFIVVRQYLRKRSLSL
jgi:VanZ family protein